MSALPYMPLYVADYLADAGHLTTEEHGAYLLLIMNYWQRGKPLPADPKRLANIARMSNERWASVEQTLSEFFVLVGETWEHNRIEAELAKVRAKSEKAKKAGKASGKARRDNAQHNENKEKSNGRSTNAKQTVNHTDTDTDTEEDKCSSAQAREGCAQGHDHSIIENKIRRAAGQSIACMAPGFHDISLITGLLAEGADLDADVIPVIAGKAKTAKAGSIRSWGYFVAAIRDAMTSRKATKSQSSSSISGVLDQFQRDIDRSRAGVAYHG